jgi:Flp pilus assembly pilin Flp
MQERGQGLVEYALILALVAIVILVILTWIGQVVFTEMYSRIGSGMVEAGG